MNICVTLFLEVKGEKKAIHLGGRVLVYSRDELNKVVSVFDKSNENTISIKIGKNSSNNKSKIITAGDFNSRIGTKGDFIVEDRKDLGFLPEGYELDTFTTHKNNEDVSLNSYGEQLIQLSIASKSRVLNGRKRGDLQGHFTYLGYPGCSIVDLVLASENIFQTNSIQYFSVQTFMTFSDHRPILLKILWKYSTLVDETTTSNCTLEDKPRRFIWNNNPEKLSTETLEKEPRSIKWNGRTLMNYKQIK